MLPFTCHNEYCKKPCKRLIAFDGNLYCENCYNIEKPRPVYLHQTEGNPWAKNLTIAKGRVIDNRVVSKDDGKTILDRRTGRPTEY